MCRTQKGTVTSESSTVNEVTGCSKRFWMLSHDARQVCFNGCVSTAFNNRGLNCVCVFQMHPFISIEFQIVYCSLFNLSTCVYLDDQDLQRLQGPLVPSWHFLDVAILWSRCICNSHLVHCSCMYIDNVNVTCTMSLYRWNLSQ